MKVCLVFFSGTGTTAQLANILRENLNEIGHTSDLIRIKHNSQIDLNTYDLFGIGAPVYSYRAPRMVTTILKKLDFQRKPFFVFSTTGGQKGNTHWNLYKSIARTAGPSLGAFSVSVTTNIRAWMPNKRRIIPNYTISEYDKNRSYEFVHKIFHNLEYKIEEIPKQNYLLSVWTALLSFRWQMALTAGFKQINRKKCTKCRICAEVICPSGAITLNEKGYPVIRERICVGCNGCVNLCPVDAIWALKSKNRHQYNMFSKYLLSSRKIKSNRNISQKN
ncbi:MAG: EFR1 family ferrodoxin [Candidatus Lokiarchaeota archaeon]|nr:EFR1 family ferrodoxin [Candidatus Lokiarchaeota archaeon]